MSRIKLGVFGSAFDPPTLGHLDVLQQAATCHDRILLVPSAFHAFDKKSQPFTIRLQMLQCFINDADAGCPLEACDLEADLLEQNPGKPVYTYDLMMALEEKYRGRVQLSFIRGPDNAHPQTWQRFYKSAEIEARWPIFTATERVAIRSTEVRRILESGKIADDDLQHGLKQRLNLLLPSVQAFIMNHNLYQTGNS